MRRITRLTACAASVLVVLGALAVPGGAATTSPTPTDAPLTYRIGITQDYDGMNPFSSWSGVSWECFRLGYDFLTWYDQDYKPAPDLAESWETSPDGKTWTFNIREGMTLARRRAAHRRATSPSPTTSSSTPSTGPTSSTSPGSPASRRPTTRRS